MTIKDASLPPTVDKFSKEFTGYPLISLLDLFSDYDQCSLAPESRDMMAFMMPFSLMRMATLPQGYTNGVQVFDRVIRKVLQKQIAQGWVKPFIDDVGVKPASKSFYRKRKQTSCRAEGDETEEGDKDDEFEEVIPRVKKYVMEAIVFLDETLADIEQSGRTISGEKSEFLKDGIKMVAFMCGSKGRTPEEAKIRKIVN